MKKQTYLLFFLLVSVVVVVYGRRTSGGGSRTGSSGSRGTFSGSRGSSGGHTWGGGGGSTSWGGGSSSSYAARNNWNKAKDRVSQQPKPQRPPAQPKPQPQPNPDHTKLTYGHNEPAPNTNNYKPSAPPMESINKQTNQHVASAPPMTNAGHQQSGNGAPPIGWNVGGQGQGGQTGHSGNVGWNTAHPTNTGNTGGAKPIGFDNVNKQTSTGTQSHAGGNNQYSTNTHVNPNQNVNGYNGYNNQPHGVGYPQQPGYGGYGGYGHPNQGYGGYGHPNQGHGGGYGGYGGHNNYHGGYSGGYGGYHPGPQGGYTSFGGYNPPGTNIHYGPVTYINGHTPAPAYSYYHSSDNSILSFFVGYSVARMFSSTHTPYFSGHTYTVHHYHHDKPAPVPEKTTVQANTIVACPQNITLLCLSNSYPVCMSNGTIMCVTNPALTVQCADNANLQCVSSTIDCSKDNSPPSCQDKNVTLSAQNTTTLSVPCVSSVSIFGDLSMLSNVINATLPANATFNATDAANTTTSLNVTMIDAANGTTVIATEITTTPAPPQQTQPQSINVFCVTVIAVPQPLNQTSFNNVTAEAARQTYATPLGDPVVQEKMWSFFGEVLDHIFG